MAKKKTEYEYDPNSDLMKIVLATYSDQMANINFRMEELLNSIDITILKKTYQALCLAIEKLWLTGKSIPNVKEHIKLEAYRVLFMNIVMTRGNYSEVIAAAHW